MTARLYLIALLASASICRAYDPEMVRKLYSVSDDELPAIQWGEIEGGFSCGLRFAKTSFVLGEPISAFVYLRNESAPPEKAEIISPAWLWSVDFIATWSGRWAVPGKPMFRGCSLSTHPLAARNIEKSPVDLNSFLQITNTGELLVTATWKVTEGRPRSGNWLVRLLPSPADFATNQLVTGAIEPSRSENPNALGKVMNVPVPTPPDLDDLIVGGSKPAIGESANLCRSGTKLSSEPVARYRRIAGVVIVVLLGLVAFVIVRAAYRSQKTLRTQVLFACL